MNTRTCSRSLVLPTDKGKTDRKAQTLSAALVQAKKSKFLLALAVWTWIVAAFVAVAFYFAVLNNRLGADWLAGLLLGMVILGWILTAYYYHAASKPVHPSVQGDRYDKQT